MKYYLVTGGTGFIGSAVVKALIKKGHKVRILDNQSRGSMRRLLDVKGKFEFINGDIRDPNIVEKACRGIDCVIHLAYINGTEFFYSKPELVLEVAVKGMVNVLDGCLKNNVDEIFLASSSEVYQTPSKIPTPENVPLLVPDPLNPRYSYGGGKIISELLTLNYGRKFFKRAVVFRPHNVFGPDMGWEHVIPQLTLRVKKIIEKNNKKQISLPIQGTGEETRAYIYIDDFVEGLLKVLEKGIHLEIYNIGSMEEMSIRNLVVGIGRCFQKEIKLLPGILSKGSTPRRCPDTTKLKKIGFNKKLNLNDGLQKTVEWYNAFAHLQTRND